MPTTLGTPELDIMQDFEDKDEEYYMEKLHELIKCCGNYPSPRYRKKDGARRYVCVTCGKSTPYYLKAGLSANIKWNEIMEEK